MGLDKLGMTESERERFEHACHETHGAVLVTGPTGSGKSTTLYAALQALNTPEKNIITVEDPVEYQLAGPHAGAGLREGRPDVRGRPALDGARRPRRDHGRGDPRPRDGADRHRVCAHRPSGALDAAHQRRALGDHAADRDGHRAVPGRLGARLRGRPAARARCSARTASSARSSPRRCCARTATRRWSTSRPTSRRVAGAAPAPAIAGAWGSTR